jgi:hypothetical protein
MYSMYVLNKIKDVCLHQNYLGILKFSKQKSVANFPIFFCTGYRERWSAEISRRSENIQALLKIGENE